MFRYKTEVVDVILASQLRGAGLSGSARLWLGTRISVRVACITRDSTQLCTVYRWSRSLGFSQYAWACSDYIGFEEFHKALTKPGKQRQFSVLPTNSCGKASKL